MTAEVAPTNLVLSTLRPGPFISGVSHSILSLGQRPLVGMGPIECSSPCWLPRLS